MDNNIIMGLTINTNFDSVNRNNTTGNNFYIIEVKNAIKITKHVMELGRLKETKTEAECDKKTQKKKKRRRSWRNKTHQTRGMCGVPSKINTEHKTPHSISDCLIICLSPGHNGNPTYHMCKFYIFCPQKTHSRRRRMARKTQHYYLAMFTKHRLLAKN